MNIFAPYCDYVDDLLMYLYKMLTYANMANNKSGVFILAVSVHALLASVFFVCMCVCLRFLSQRLHVPFNFIYTGCSKMITWLIRNVNKHESVKVCS